MLPPLMNFLGALHGAVGAFDHESHLTARQGTWQQERVYRGEEKEKVVQ